MKDRTTTQVLQRYLLMFAGLTMLRFTTALFCWRSCSSAKWIASLNAPGMLIAAYVVGMVAIDLFS